MKMKFTFLVGLCLLTSLVGYSQCIPGFGDPAVTSRNLLDQPLNGVGSPFRLQFKIGNFGAGPICGTDPTNRMGFRIELSRCAPYPAGSGTAALLGPLLPYFDITYNSATNQFVGIQKQGVAIPDLRVFILEIQLQVTQPSNPELQIGGSCTIIPDEQDINESLPNNFGSIYTSEQGAMPISLVWFKADAQSNKTVNVTWQTSLESGNKGYVIERSKDLKKYEIIGEVNDVAANSTSLTNYTFTDATPYRGLSYYRLKQVDLAGTSRTYAAVPVTVEGMYGVYPNPVSVNGFTLALDEPASSVLSFYTATGRRIDLQKGNVRENQVEVKPAEKLSSGLYVLQVEERGQVRTHRLVVE